MRPGPVAFGIIFVILGLTFFFVTISDQSVGSAVIGPSSPYVFYVPNATPASLNFSVDYNSDSSSTVVTVAVYSCGTNTACTPYASFETPQDRVASQTGVAGFMYFTGTAGDGYEVVPSSSNVFTLVDYSGPLFGGFFGLFFLILGLLALIPGLVMKKKSGTAAARGRKLGAAPVAPPPPPPVVNYMAGASPPPGGGAGLSGSAGLSGVGNAPVYPGAPSDPSNPGKK